MIYNCFVESLPQYLLAKYRQWEDQTQQKQSVSAWARYLGVKQVSLSRWMNGDYPPSGDNLHKLANKLGYEIYAIVGVEPPSDLTKTITEAQAAYNALPPDGQAALMNSINQAIQEIISEYGGRRTK